MKCQQCKADTWVRETRKFQEVFTKRRHECFNGHRFSTYEVTKEYLDIKKFAKGSPEVEIDVDDVFSPHYVSNTGVPGVYWRDHPTGGYYRVFIRREGKTMHLGNTKDFFKAVCRRKSYEVMLSDEGDLT